MPTDARTPTDSPVHAASKALKSWYKKDGSVQRIKVAIYARRSKAGGKESSIERQVEVCRSYMESFGPHEETQYIDRGKSGKTTIGRKDFDRMIRDCMEGLITHVVVENADRLARDLTDMLTTFRDLSHLGIEFHSIAGGGKMDKLKVVLSGIVAETSWADLKLRMASAREQAARNGARMSRPPYGYQFGKTKKVVEVVEKEAEVIRMIFDLFTEERVSVPDIARMLNREGIPAPASGKWNPGSIRGNDVGGGILRRTKYTGHETYGVTQILRDPKTNKRKVLTRDADEWIVTDGVYPRIITDEQFVKAQGILRERYSVQEARQRGNRNLRATKRRLFSHGVNCSSCGSPMRFYARSRMHACPKAALDGCENKGSTKQDAVELAALRAAHLGITQVANDIERENARWAPLRARLQGARNQLHQIDAELGKLLRKDLSGQYPNEVLVKEREDLTRRRSQILETSRRHPELTEDVSLDYEKYARFSDGVAEAMQTLAMGGILREYLVDCLDPVFRQIRIGPCIEGRRTIAVSLRLDPLLLSGVLPERERMESIEWPGTPRHEIQSQKKEADFAVRPRLQEPEQEAIRGFFEQSGVCLFTPYHGIQLKEFLEVVFLGARNTMSVKSLVRFTSKASHRGWLQGRCAAMHGEIRSAYETLKRMNAEAVRGIDPSALEAFLIRATSETAADLARKKRNRNLTSREDSARPRRGRKLVEGAPAKAVLRNAGPSGEIV